MGARDHTTVRHILCKQEISSTSGCIICVLDKWLFFKEENYNNVKRLFEHLKKTDILLIDKNDFGYKVVLVKRWCEKFCKQINF